MSLGLNALLVEDSTATKALFFLALAFVVCFLSRKDFYWFTCICLFLALGVMASRIMWPGVLILSITGGLLAVYHLKINLPMWGRLAVTLLALGIGAALSLHLLPGFDNWHVGRDVIKGSGRPFQLYLNFDKPFFGVVFFALAGQAARSQKSWKVILKPVFIALPGALIAVLGGAFTLGWLNLEVISPPDWIGVWVFKNLFLTVIAEEALFRGLIQKELHQYLPSKWKWLALVMASFLFGLAHFGGGTRYVLAATFAGLFYGWVWQRAGQRLEASILTHFGLNLTHLLLFTYPQ